MWKRIKSIENIVSTSNDSFDKALKLGLIIYYDQNSNLQMLNGKTLDQVCDYLESGSTYYKVVDESIFLKFGNVIKRFNLNGCYFEMFCSTEEENIRILNSKYCLGSTSKRKPRISRSEIISTLTNEVIYKWEDEKVLISCKNEMYLFQTKFKGNLYLLDIASNEKVWEIAIDAGIAGRRYLEFLDNNKLLVQRYFSVDHNNLLKVDLTSGTTLWEVENTLSFYCYDELVERLYGIGGKTFEIINANTGKRELQVELKENLHIMPHLTYYDEDLLYFSGYKDKNVPVFGAVNVENGELVFTQEVEIPGEKSFRKGLDRPIVIGNRLYVRDSMKTLHIYENVDFSKSG